MKHCIIVCFAILILISCSPNSTEPTLTLTNTPQPSNTPTETPTQMPTQTPVPLADLNFEQIMIQEGDLPAGYSGAQIRDRVPEMFDSLPEPQNEAYQQIAHKDEAAGGVSIILYDSHEDLKAAYNEIVDGMKFEEDSESIDVETIALDEVGEQATACSVETSVLGQTFESLDLVFLRCQAIAHIRMTDTTNLDYGLSYAQRLDERLQPMVCQ